MRVLKNILITLGLAVGGVILGALAQQAGIGGDKIVTEVIWLVVIGSSVWAATEAKRLAFHRYKNGLASGPTAIFLVCLLLWVVAFPWFLTLRDKILDGTAELKDEFRSQVPPPLVPPIRSVRPVEPPPLPSVPPAAPVPPRAPLTVEERVSQLQRLGQLREQGLLSESEFQQEKQKLLGGA